MQAPCPFLWPPVIYTGRYKLAGAIKQFTVLRVNAGMDVFNIKIGYGENELTLTILPAGDGCYQVIYFGGILGAVRPDGDHDGWEKVPDEEVIAGDLPLYEHDMRADRLDIVLDENTVQRIGEEINNAH